MVKVNNEEEKSSDESEKLDKKDLFQEIDWEPFPLDFNITETELTLLKDAFNNYKSPEDNKISFKELFFDLETIQVKKKNPMLY